MRLAPLYLSEAFSSPEHLTESCIVRYRVTSGWLRKWVSLCSYHPACTSGAAQLSFSNATVWSASTQCLYPMHGWQT